MRVMRRARAMLRTRPLEMDLPKVSSTPHPWKLTGMAEEARMLPALQDSAGALKVATLETQASAHALTPAQPGMRGLGRASVMLPQ